MDNHSLEHKQRIVIAGGGIIGASIAYHLARRGAQVTVLEKGQPGGGATQNSFAWINATFSKQPWHYYLLSCLGIQAWQQMEREFGDALKIQWGGTIKWEAEHEPAGLLREQVRHHQAWGYATRLVHEGELRRLEPRLSFGDVATAAYCEMEGHLDPVHAVEVLLQQAQQRGARMETGCEVTGVQRRGQLWALQTTKGELEADLLVIACGVDTARVAALAGVSVPLKDSPGLLLHTTPQEPLLNRIILAPSAHIKQKLDGSIVTGANFGGSPISCPAGTTDSSQESAKRMLAEAARVIPALKGAEIEKVTLGWRPLPKDDYPIIGYAKDVPAIYLTVMHSGITLAALVGRLAAIEILDGVQVELLQPYRLERFRNDASDFAG